MILTTLSMTIIYLVTIYLVTPDTETVYSILRGGDSPRTELLRRESSFLFLYCAIQVISSDTSEQNDIEINIKKVNGVVKKSDIGR